MPFTQEPTSNSEDVDPLISEKRYDPNTSAAFHTPTFHQPPTFIDFPSSPPRHEGMSTPCGAEETPCVTAKAISHATDAVTAATTNGVDGLTPATTLYQASSPSVHGSSGSAASSVSPTVHAETSRQRTQPTTRLAADNDIITVGFPQNSCDTPQMTCTAPPPEPPPPLDVPIADRAVRHEQRHNHPASSQYLLTVNVQDERLSVSSGDDGTAKPVTPLGMQSTRHSAPRGVMAIPGEPYYPQYFRETPVNQRGGVTGTSAHDRAVPLNANARQYSPAHFGSPHGVGEAHPRCFSSPNSSTQQPQTCTPGTSGFAPLPSELDRYGPREQLSSFHGSSYHPGNHHHRQHHQYQGNNYGGVPLYSSLVRSHEQEQQQHHVLDEAARRNQYHSEGLPSAGSGFASSEQRYYDPMNSEDPHRHGFDDNGESRFDAKTNNEHLQITGELHLPRGNRAEHSFSSPGSCTERQPPLTRHSASAAASDSTTQQDTSSSAGISVTPPPLPTRAQAQVKPKPPIPQSVEMIRTLQRLACVCGSILTKAADATGRAKSPATKSQSVVTESASNSKPVVPAYAVALDLEGKNLGKKGSISIVTLATDTCVYLVDVVLLGAAAFAPENKLRAILESSTITKLMFDCRADCDALYFLYQVQLQCVCDLQVSACLTLTPYGSYLPGMKSIFERLGYFSDADSSVKEKGRAFFDPRLGGSFDNWEKHPLPKLLETYCAVDVKYFFSAHSFLSEYEYRAFSVASDRLRFVRTGKFESNSKQAALRDFFI